MTGVLTGTSATFSGALTAGSLSVAGVSSGGGVTAPYFTATDTAATSSFQGFVASFANITSGAVGTLDVSGKTTLAYASTTGITASYASTSALVASNSFTFGSATGFLKATAGVVGEALVNLASDVTGILPVGNGGTGWGALAPNTLLTGNGSGAVSTTTVGNGLALSGGVLSTSFGTTTANVWTSLQTFAGGLFSISSSTVGNGTQQGGLTISGGATTTGSTYLAGPLTASGSAYFGTSVNVGALLATANFAVASTSASVSDPFVDRGRIAFLTGTVETGGAITILQSVCGSYTVTGLDGLQYQTVLGEDGKCWFASNLGTTHVATAYGDTASYGDLYQWGRARDGHQIATSGTTATLDTTYNQNNGGLFILPSASPYDWLNPQDGNLWGDANRTNNVCPAGWHVPSQSEWQTWATAAGVASCSSNCLQAMYNTNLKLPAAGSRFYGTGSLGSQGGGGGYWSSSVSGAGASYLNFYSSNVGPAFTGDRAYGFSVRCIQGS